MRVAVLSDTHWKGTDAVPEHVLDLLEDAELIIHAGDLKCEKVLESLEGGGRQVVAVRGNNFELDLASLPDVRVEDLQGFRVGIAHDIGSVQEFACFSKKPEDIFGEPVDCVIFGQTHHPFFDVFHGVPFINPGSATDQDHSGAPGTLALLDINGRLRSVSFIQV
ncbi:MAG: YfcE family phosphodiesterase [Chloroflexi bacterium]|nr:YfcE family phosphodiesterase [Chloroflexota bacterium]